MDAAPAAAACARAADHLLPLLATANEEQFSPCLEGFTAVAARMEPAAAACARVADLLLSKLPAGTNVG
jgi:hypothetical protein